MSILRSAPNLSELDKKQSKQKARSWCPLGGATLPLVAIDPRPTRVLQSGMISSAVGCRWILILLAAVLPVSAAYFPPPDAEGGWRCATNGQSVIRRRAGLDARRLAQAWEYNQRCSQNAGLLVVRHGWLAWERYVGRANREARPDMASTGKAYTSIACGMLLQEFPTDFPRVSKLVCLLRSSYRRRFQRRVVWMIPVARISHSVICCA